MYFWCQVKEGVDVSELRLLQNFSKRCSVVSVAPEQLAVPFSGQHSHRDGYQC